MQALSIYMLLLEFGWEIPMIDYDSAMDRLIEKGLKATFFVGFVLGVVVGTAGVASVIVIIKLIFW